MVTFHSSVSLPEGILSIVVNMYIIYTYSTPLLQARFLLPWPPGLVKQLTIGAKLIGTSIAQRTRRRLRLDKGWASGSWGETLKGCWRELTNECWMLKYAVICCIIDVYCSMFYVSLSHFSIFFLDALDTLLP